LREALPGGEAKAKGEERKEREALREEERSQAARLRASLYKSRKRRKGSPYKEKQSERPIKATDKRLRLWEPL